MACTKLEQWGRSLTEMKYAEADHPPYNTCEGYIGITSKQHVYSVLVHHVGYWCIAL